MIVKFFSIHSENCKNVYIGFTTKSSILQVFEQYKYFYNQYVNKTTRTKRRYFPIFEQNDPYIVLIGECEVKSSEELFKTLREIKLIHQENCINFKEIYHENIENAVRKYKRKSLMENQKNIKSPTIEKNTVKKSTKSEMNITLSFPIQNIELRP